MDIKRIKIRITGRQGSPLVVHHFNDKTKKEILDKQQKRGKRAKEARDPEAEFEMAKYLDDEGRECFPVEALKKSAVDGGRAMDNLKMTEVRQALFVDTGTGSQLVPILTPDGRPAKGVMREDAVTIGQGKRGLTYRPEYKAWTAEVYVEFNKRMVSLEQVIMLFEEAGFGVGICEGRPQKTSALGWGRFAVELLEELN